MFDLSDVLSDIVADLMRFQHYYLVLFSFWYYWSLLFTIICTSISSLIFISLPFFSFTTVMANVYKTSKYKLFVVENPDLHQND